MPADAIHLTALREGLARARVPAEARRTVARAEHAARLGALWVDLPYFATFKSDIARYALGRTLPTSHWGTETHERAVPLLRAVIRRGCAVSARDGGEVARCEAAAFAIGLASHLAIDRALHPLVNWLAERRTASTARMTHDQAHREVEKFHTICFHEAYFGHDPMGTSRLATYMQIDGIDRLDRGIGELGRGAMHDAFGSAPSPAVVRRWGNNYVHYVRLLASPAGKLIAPPAARAAAAPLFLHGEWGSFATYLERAIEASVDVIEIVWSLFQRAEHAPADEELKQALAGVMDDGTIDPPGSTFSPR